MRIVIRVIASKSVGLGHVYRALTLAEEFGEHKVSFVCSRDAMPIVEGLLDGRWLATYGSGVDDILCLGPDLIINDVLDTDADYMMGLKAGSDAKVVNFEDLGLGANHADLVINALFQEPQREGDQYLWGIDNFFLRDEFTQAKQAAWSNKVESVLVTFGGTDQTNLTEIVIDAIAGDCREKGITLYVVVGPGYDYEASLMKTLWEWGNERVFFVRETGMMAQIMGRCQFAFVSNGRTVYELAHMHVPAMVIAHHDRENTHDFAHEGNGFINLGVYGEGETKFYARRQFQWIIDTDDTRHELWQAMQRFDLSGNKAQVAKLILGVMGD